MSSPNNNVFIISSSNGKKLSEYLFVILSLLLLVVVGYSKNGNLSILFIVFLLIPIKKPILLLPVLFAAAVTSSFFLSSANSQVSLSRIIVIIFIFYSIINFALNKKRLQNSKTIIWLFALLSILLLSTLLSETLSFVPFISFALNLVLFYIMSLYVLEEEEKKRLYNYMIISALIIGITIIYISYKSNAINIISQRLSIEEVNANRLAMATAQVIIVLVFVIITFLKRKKVFILLVLSGLTAGLIFVLLLTGSRTAFLAILSSSALIIILFFSGRSIRKLIIRVFLIGVISYGTYIFIESKYEFVGVFERFSVENMKESKGTHRLENAALIIKYVIPRNFFLGVGIGADNIKVALGMHNQSFKNAAHNIIIDPLSQIGILGFVLLWYMFINVLKKSIYIFKNGYFLMGLPLSLLLVSIFNGIGETMYTTRFIWFAMGLCLIFLNVERKNQIHVKSEQNN